MKTILTVVSRYKRDLISNFIISFLATLPIILIVLMMALPKLKKTTIFGKKQTPKIAVETAFNILNYYQAKVDAKTLSMEEAQTQAKETIKALRYSKNEYLWINDHEPTMIMHPFKPSLDGKNVANVKDPKGKFLFKEMVATVKDSPKGEGYVYYMWERPNSKVPVDKVSFVKLFKPWGWIVGSGVYIDDVQAAVKENEQAILFLLFLTITFSIVLNLVLAYKKIVNFIMPIEDSVKTLNTKTIDLDESTSDMNNISETLSDNVSSQTSALHQYKQSLSRASSLSQKTEENTAESQKTSEITKDKIVECLTKTNQLNESINKMLNSHENLVKMIQENNENLEQFQDRFNQISSSTDAINDIVFQTKLLSFNASVEAARAGETGQGFSVVAQEIGSLANRSGDSAKDIFSIIEESKSEVNKIIETSSSNITRVINESKATFDQTTSSMNEFTEIFNNVINLSDKLVNVQKENTSMISDQKIAIEEMLEATELLNNNNNETDRVSNKNNQLAQDIVSLGNNIKEISDILEKTITKQG